MEASRCRVGGYRVDVTSRGVCGVSTTVLIDAGGRCFVDSDGNCARDEAGSRRSRKGRDTVVSVAGWFEPRRGPT